MTTEEFVQGFYRQKQLSLQFYLDHLAQADGTLIPQHIQLLDGQQLTVPQLLENVLTDTLYSVLLGLEGSASIGGVQTRYDLRDVAGNSLNDGNMGGYAWQYFQNDGEEPA